jgi:CoA:oxalate CoA-transferase
VGASIGDITAGLFTAIGIAAALHHRNSSGAGMKIDVAMLDCQVAILENAISRYFLTGESPRPLGARHASIAPFAAFATSDGHMIIAAGTDAIFRKLCNALGRPDLAKDSRFVSNDRRAANVEVLTSELEGELRTRPTKEWLSRFEAIGVPCGPINDIAAVVDDPQVRARNMIVDLDDRAAGPLKLAGNPIKLSAFPDPSNRPAAPLLDADRERILAELNGVPAADLA